MLSAIDHENGDPDKPSNQVVFSLDAEALYPSMECNETAHICGLMVTQSGLWFEAIDWEEACLYLVLTGNKGSLPEDCLPKRRDNAGPKPTITTLEILGPIERNKTKSKFESPLRPPTEEEKLEIIYLVVQTGIYTVMKNHTYRWNQELKLQGKGGGIGDKLAQAAARLDGIGSFFAYLEALA